MDIRPVNVGDSTDLAALLQELGFSRIAEMDPQNLNQYVSARVSGAGDQYSIYVAAGYRIVGFISVHWLPYLILGGQEGYISELFVLEEYRGKGIGSQLLERVKQEARMRNCVRLNLINSQDRLSYKLDFYKKQGFSERTEFKNFVWYNENSLQ